MVKGCGRSRQGLALALGFLLAGVLGFGLDSASAQTKTTKKKTPPKKTETTTKKKTEAPEKDLPPVKEEPEAEAVVTIKQSLDINTEIEKKWKENGIIKASRRASDYQFARRVSLDLIGRILKHDELAKYMSDPASARRGMLVDRLLNSEEYAENWSNIWTTWLMTRSGNKLYHEQMQVWLEEQFAKNRPWNEIVGGTPASKRDPKDEANDPKYQGLLTASGDNNENGAVNFILSHLGEPTPQPKIAEEGPFNYVPITSRTTRLFLGLQTQCTQCHDHPFNPQWKQKHFWGVNAFFRNVVRDGNPMMRGNQRGMAPPKLGLRDNAKLNANQMVFYETRKAVVLATRPSFLDGKKLDPKGTVTRREQLAKYVTEHEMFAKAYVNRMWAHFFGRGMTVNGKDIDDFGEHNAETHPELLAYLAKEFIESGHDSKALIRWITNSKAYSLSSVADGQVEEEDEKTKAKSVVVNDKPSHEPWFSRMLLKSMSPEQLFSSLWVSTYDNPRAGAKKSRDEKLKLRQAWMDRLIVNFGDDEGNETTFNGTVIQALLLMNGDEINNAITAGDGPVESAIKYAQRKGSINTIMDELFLATLNRRPTRDEINKIKKDMNPVLVMNINQKNPSGPWQDLMWALLNSSEFILNH